MIPTLNEIGNLPNLVEGLDRLLLGNPDLKIAEVIIVDDGSSDGTLEYISRLSSSAKPYSLVLISRAKKGGSGSAEIVGIQRATTRYVLKMDADGQHPLSMIPAMIGRISDHTDVVIGSRYVPGGSNQWPAIRGLISRLATAAAYILIPEVRHIRDPLSGFYVVRRTSTNGLDPRKSKYKALLHIMAANHSLSVIEIPFVMTGRTAGESKIVGVSGEYIFAYTVELLGYMRLASKLRLSRRHAPRERAR